MTDRKGSSAAYEPYEVIGALLTTARMHRKHAERYVRSTGLHPTQHRVLMYLARRDAPSKQKELSDAFELTPAAVVQIIDKLESEGFVARAESETDARCKRIALTEKGRETAAESSAAFRTLDVKFLEGISDADIEVFCSVLHRMQRNQEEETGRGKETV